MAVNWVTFLGAAKYIQPLHAISQPIQGAMATTFYLENASGHRLTFFGQFTLDAGNNIIGGTITGFKGYINGVQALNAYGYQLDFNAFNAARTAPGSTTLFDLLQPDGFTLSGKSLDDILLGGRFNDTITSVEGDDIIKAGAGNDLITPGEGKDDVDGGDGNDIVSYVDRTSPIDVVLKGPVQTTVKVGGVDEDLIQNVENVLGGTANDRLTGDGLSNGLFGFDGDDKIKGKDGNDILAGNDGRDKLNGQKGNDQITGGDGNDLLKGGKDSDTFVFIDALDKVNNVDKIKGFKPDVDKISLYSGVFSGLDIGDLKAKYFHEGDKAADKTDHIIYDDGKLSFDIDGKGGAKQVEFAVLKSRP